MMSTWSRSDTGGGSFYESMVDNAARCTCMLSSKISRCISNLILGCRSLCCCFFFPHCEMLHLWTWLQLSFLCLCLYCCEDKTRCRYCAWKLQIFQLLKLLINASRMRERSSAISLVISYTLTGQLSVGFRFGYGCSLLYNLCVS